MARSAVTLPGDIYPPDLVIGSNLKFKLPRSVSRESKLFVLSGKFAKTRFGKYPGTFSTSGFAGRAVYKTDIPTLLSNFSSKVSSTIGKVSSTSDKDKTLKSYTLNHIFPHKSGVKALNIDTSRLGTVAAQESFSDTHDVHVNLNVKKSNNLKLKGSKNSDDFSVTYDEKNPFKYVPISKINASGDGGDDLFRLSTVSKKATFNLGEGDDFLSLRGAVDKLKVIGGDGDDIVEWRNILKAKTAIFDMGAGSDRIEIRPENGVLPNKIIVRLGEGADEEVKIIADEEDVLSTKVIIKKFGQKRTAQNSAHLIFSASSTTEKLRQWAVRNLKVDGYSVYTRNTCKNNEPNPPSFYPDGGYDCFGSGYNKPPIRISDFNFE